MAVEPKRSIENIRPFGAQVLTLQLITIEDRRANYSEASSIGEAASWLEWAESNGIAQPPGTIIGNWRAYGQAALLKRNREGPFKVRYREK